MVAITVIINFKRLILWSITFLKKALQNKTQPAQTNCVANSYCRVFQLYC